MPPKRGFIKRCIGYRLESSRPTVLHPRETTFLFRFGYTGRNLFYGLDQVEVILHSAKRMPHVSFFASQNNTLESNLREISPARPATASALPSVSPSREALPRRMTETSRCDCCRRRRPPRQDRDIRHRDWAICLRAGLAIPGACIAPAGPVPQH